jgi:AraC-like DNA-binding protein
MAFLLDQPRLHGAVRTTTGGRAGWHAHRQVELTHVSAGRAEIGVGDQRIAGAPGTLYVLPAGVPHAQLLDAPWTRTNLLYTGGERLLPTTARALAIGDDPLLGRWMDDISAMVRSAQSLPREADALLYAVLLRLGERERRLSTQPALPPAVRIAVEYLDEHLDQEISGEQLARIADLSVSRLGALFRLHLGRGPLQHLQHLRMTLAGNLLRDGDASLAAVASACGYRDVGYFIRHFHRAYGAPPQRWRRSRSPSQRDQPGAKTRSP